MAPLRFNKPDGFRSALPILQNGIRKTIGAEPPENDPFAPPPERQARPAVAQKLPPATVKLPEMPAKPNPLPPQVKPAMKAALLAVQILGGNGFRKPSKKKAAKSRPVGAVQGRGPPR